AYRGEASMKGWTTEAHLLKGELRTNELSVAELLQKPGAVILKYADEVESLTGCVYLEKQDKKMYLGMLSVSPDIQAKGIGKKLLSASEEHAKNQNCSSIIMNVISVRHELISWYERHGYQKNGEKKPFPVETKFGVPTQPLEFVVLEKTINP
ncbi:MAG: GNAT family N-acetyltransferase, partial [Chitinophagales bacterium]